MAAGGIAIGVDLERRIVPSGSREPAADDREFFELRSDGPDVTTPDGVVLHTEVDEAPAPMTTRRWCSSMAMR